MIDSLNICLPCGLCCDGILIGYVALFKDEIPAIRKIKKIEEENGEGFFLQPCENNKCDGCNIYANRPKHCASFKCGLLKSVEQEKTDYNLALEIINEVKQKQALIEKKIILLKFKLKSKSFNFKMIELNNLLKKKNASSSINKEEKDLLSDINQLNQLLLKEFGLPLF